MNNDIPQNPLDLFNLWYAEAEKSELSYANAMSLATVNEKNQPAVRVVLMRGHDESGVYFYTNYESDKGRALIANPYAEVNFYWKSQEKQIRICGSVEKVSAKTSDTYFNGRPRTSRIGAWASEQSRPMNDYGDFEKRIQEFEKKFEGQENPPRPPHWGGFKLIPDKYEFWSEEEFRLHKRFTYKRQSEKSNWDVTWLYP